MTTISERPALRQFSYARRWPDIAAVPHAPARAALARRFFRHAASKVAVRVIESSGSQYGGGGASDPVLRLNRPQSFFHRLGRSGTIGFGEAYMAADWTAEDLTGVLTAFATHLDQLVPRQLRPLRRLVMNRIPTAHDNSVDGARENISHHYDLSNELFATFLDPSLTYSSALFGGEPSASGDTLQQAQHRKIDRLLDCAAVGPGQQVLEIGTGWGELAIRAAGRGATVTSLTISTEQADLARERIAAAGLADRVSVLLQDYRAVRGTYDSVVSVEMIEAVGANYWPQYFRTIDRVLRPGGRVGLQAILQPDDRLRRTGDSYGWIRKYIFPGGLIASPEAIARTLAAGTSLRIADMYCFGRHYAETLRRWRATFEAHAAQIDQIGFDETFQRMWSLYLAYSEAGFNTGYLDVGQLTLTKPVR
jgi:cyclopropane-fatty-acyl-phospholipid synthase